MAVRLQLPQKKAPNPTDQHIGARVRMRRKMLAMSQTQLADALGITYQQVQKNETGINRIAASRLQQMSHILQVPVAFFFKGAPNAAAPHGSHRSAFTFAISPHCLNSRNRSSDWARHPRDLPIGDR